MNQRTSFRLIAIGTLLAGPLLVACEPGTPVVLNERLFELPSMKSLGSGCMRYELGGNGSSASGGGGVNQSLVVGQRSDNDRVIVDVTNNGSVVVERIYALPFFQSGKLDEFTASAGGQMMLLRYWGGFDPQGTPQCSPFTDDGPPTTAP